MTIKIGDFQATPGKNIELSQWPTHVKHFYDSKKDYKEALEDGINELSKQQKVLYAANSHAVLIVFQAMDAAGKDGAIRHVMSGVNPQGCQVFSFKHPSANELEHDFLWRTTKCLPERGRIGIFNRSYYEEVLIARVHPEIFKAERIPCDAIKTGNVWQERFDSIVDLEKHLHRNGTRIIKFFLHMSKEEQRKRFLDRIDEEDKNWKFSQGDIEERKYWDEYMRVYESCINHTTTEDAPWYIVPADNKKNARLIISKIILSSLERLKMTYPQVSKTQEDELKKCRKLLEEESSQKPSS